MGEYLYLTRPAKKINTHDKNNHIDNIFRILKSSKILV